MNTCDKHPDVELIWTGDCYKCYFGEDAEVVSPLTSKIHLPEEIESALNDGADLAISVSGGKDSDAMAFILKALHEERGWTGKIELIHADLGRVEWKQTGEYVEKLAERLDLPLSVVARPQGDLMARWWQRHETRPEVPPWSSAAARFCTSDLKRAQIDKWLRKFTPEGTVICAMGIRAEESPARAKQSPVKERKAIATKKRTAISWMPIFNFSTEDVWEALGTSSEKLEELKAEVEEVVARNENPFVYISKTDWPAHPAYVLGNDRLSCAICILGSKKDIMNGIQYQPELYRQMVELEDVSGFSFRQDMKLSELRPDLLD